MEKTNIYLGNSELITEKSKVIGQFVVIDGEMFYQIKNYHEIPDFFISLVSDSDHWMFLSSNGSLSAGRKYRDNALFPYYTVDKIHDYRNMTGSKTYILAEKAGKRYLWEPFTEESKNFYRITCNIYKSIYGNKVLFEEINASLGLSFRYGWHNSEKFGFVKKSQLRNTTDSPIAMEVLDGIRNILPYGVDYSFQNEYSNLLDAYKKNERLESSTLGLFMLSAIPVDRAEPSEALKTTTVWSTGMGKESRILISDRQIAKFKSGLAVESENDIRASRGAYHIYTSIGLEPGEKNEWYTVAEINQGSTDVANLNHFIRQTKDLGALINQDIEKGTLNLKKMVAMADGFQKTNTAICYTRHYANTLYNIMRGGIFLRNYDVETDDFKQYVWQINRLVYKEKLAWLENLPDRVPYMELTELAIKTEDADLTRITFEYLPLTFSRRHGDPSRPWNLFSIQTKDEKGRVKYNYEGNWRDIFQNWEALCLSYPEFVEGIICKFVNASTIDGYNPYRIMRNGIDWECPDPDDPWAYIGYWGDHQIIYLQKLLELSDMYHPGRLDELLTTEIFTYANIPYRIKSYKSIVRNPKDTIDFDAELNTRIKTEAEHLGADASLLKNRNEDRIYKVNLTEKILVTLLSKLGNFIPDAGIWLNTQRPEWNDANNALVGNGTSMVTLYYLRRFLKFWENKFNASTADAISLSEEVVVLFEKINNFYKENAKLLSKGFTETDRKNFADFLGKASWKYRNKIYKYSFSGEKSQLSAKQILDFIKLSLKFIDHSIKKNKRQDGLYHAYNLITIRPESISVRHLYEMLEGQVAVLSAGVLSPAESLEVLDALQRSKIFRPDQYSYMLYPNRELPRFTEKNNIPAEVVKSSALLVKLLEDHETSIIEVDIEGQFHFNGSFRNAASLSAELDKLRYGTYSLLVEEDKEKILEIFESVFDHQSFTGRSGTFYGYEGLGSIYWHMVSKLLLATQECYFRAVYEKAEESTISKIKNHYYEIKAGIGFYKSPALYGAFPMDAYSHTPSDSGVKQPGLTGQVKEDIISRLGETGVFISEGKIRFMPALLNTDEILEKNMDFEYYTTENKSCSITLEKNQIGLTLCQVPVVITFSEEDSITVFSEDGSSKNIKGSSLDEKTSGLIFRRTGEIKKIEVTVKKNDHVR